MLFGKKETAVERDPSPEGQMKLEVTIKLSRTNKSYGDASVIASAEAKENMILTTDASSLSLKNELESIIAETYKKIEKQIDTSPFLTNDYFGSRSRDTGATMPAMKVGDNE